jgi:SAM-dependent methyltransferase
MIAGERQVAPTRACVRRDHVARYEWAAARLKELTGGAEAHVLDIACGIGYGTQLLAEAGFWALGADRDAEALDYARTHYVHARAQWEQVDAAVGLNGLGNYVAAVCFETIEHLEDPAPLLRALHERTPLLLASVPNELVFPHGGKVLHHFRHYTPQEFALLLDRCGWRVREWHGQLGPESEVEPERIGRTMIVLAERSEDRRVKPDAGQVVTVPAQVPEHVAIVGLGPSCAQFFELTRRQGGVSAYCDEVWGINAIGDVLRCDRVFHMDDVRIQEARAAEMPDSNIAAMVRWLKTHPGPVYTSIAREGYPGLVPFPLEAVLNSLGAAPYFNSTAAYAIAFAVHLGVKKISLYGLDYTLPDRHRAEKGRACCEFWLGMAQARGIEIQVPNKTSLLDACEPDELRLYGYDCVDVDILNRAEGRVAVEFYEKPAIPSAAEIEARYNHGQHPNPLMRAGAAV